MTRPTGDRTVADRQQLARISLDTDNPICQVCGQPLQEGADVTAYAYRAAGDPAYEIGYVMCGGDGHEHPTVFTRGVREEVLIGHIGTCADVRTQSTTYILLDPTVVVTSPARSSEPYVQSDAPAPRTPIHLPQQEPTPLLTAVREHARSDGGTPRGGSE